MENDVLGKCIINHLHHINRVITRTNKTLDEIYQEMDIIHIPYVIQGMIVDYRICLHAQNLKWIQLFSYNTRG